MELHDGEQWEGDRKTLPEEKNARGDCILWVNLQFDRDKIAITPIEGDFMTKATDGSRTKIVFRAEGNENIIRTINLPRRWENQVQPGKYLARREEGRIVVSLS